MQELSNVNTKQACTFENIPGKVLKSRRGSYSDILKALISKNILAEDFSNEFKVIQTVVDSN